MNITYSFTTTALCPIDGSTDIYDVEVRADGAYEVEKLLALADAYRTKAIFQEDLTQLFASALGEAVRITGWHSGVKVVSEA